MRLLPDLSSLRDAKVRWAALGFFALLAGYSLLRPVREEMGITGGVEQLPWMYTGTFVAILLALVPVSWVVAKYRRGVVVPAMYAAFAASLVAFFLAVRG